MNTVDGRVPSTRRCRCGKLEGSCKHITFGEETDPTSYWRNLSPRDPLSESRGIKPSAVGVNVSRSLTATQSRLLRKLDTIRQYLNIVELEFRTIEDKMDFKAAYDALRRLTELDGFRRQNQPLLREEAPPSEYQSPTEQGSLGRQYESAAIDAGNMIPTVLQKGDNTEITPFYRAKPEKGDFLTLVPHSPPALAGGASNHIGETVRLAEDEGRKRRLGFGERRPIESVERARRRQQRAEEERDRRIDEARRRRQQRAEEERDRRIDEAMIRQEEGDIERLRQLQDRMAEQECLDRLRRAKIPRQPRHHPPFSFEHNLDKGSESIESGPSASFVRESLPALGDEEQLLEIEKQVNRKIQRASIETSTKREQWRHRICRRIVIFMLWKREQHICVPNELWSSPTSFEFINVLEMSTFDKAKGLFETYSGREWNWWPFSAAVKPLESGRVRIRWQCVGELSSSITMC